MVTQVPGPVVGQSPQEQEDQCRLLLLLTPAPGPARRRATWTVSTAIILQSTLSTFPVPPGWQSVYTTWKALENLTYLDICQKIMTLAKQLPRNIARFVGWNLYAIRLHIENDVIFSVVQFQSSVTRWSLENFLAAVLFDRRNSGQRACLTAF